MPDRSDTLRALVLGVEVRADAPSRGHVLERYGPDGHGRSLFAAYNYGELAVLANVNAGTTEAMPNG